MKKVLLSADSEMSVYSVPDEVADYLEKYCMEFCSHWLHESPDAAKYRIRMGNAVAVCYTEKDFIEYLNRYICEEMSEWITTFTNVYSKKNLPKEYAKLPHFHF